MTYRGGWIGGFLETGNSTLINQLISRPPPRLPGGGDGDVPPWASPGPFPMAYEGAARVSFSRLGVPVDLIRAAIRGRDDLPVAQLVLHHS